MLAGFMKSRRSGNGSKAGEKIVAQISIHGSIADSGQGGGGVNALSKSSSLCLNSLRNVIDEAFNVNNLAAVVLSINCSSGSPVQCSILSKYLREMANDTGVPLLAMVEDAAICGGYWLACAADVIFANQNSMIGSIGSMSVHVNMHQLLQQYDVESRIMATHPNKIGPNPLAPLDAAFRKQERIQMDNMKIVHNNFVRWVRQRRENKLHKRHTGEIFDGRVFVGNSAKNVGLVDYVGGKEEIDNYLASHANARGRLRWVDIEKLAAPQGLANLLPFLSQATGIFSWLIPAGWR